MNSESLVRLYDLKSWHFCGFIYFSFPHLFQSGYTGLLVVPKCTKYIPTSGDLLAVLYAQDIFPIKVTRLTPSPTPHLCLNAILPRSLPWSAYLKYPLSFPALPFPLCSSSLSSAILYICLSIGLLGITPPPTPAQKSISFSRARILVFIIYSCTYIASKKFGTELVLNTEPMNE